MKTQKQEILNVTFVGQEINNFRSLIKKLNTDNKKIGFKHKLLNPDEMLLITDINKVLKYEKNSL